MERETKTSFSTDPGGTALGPSSGGPPSGVKLPKPLPANSATLWPRREHPPPTGEPGGFDARRRGIDEPSRRVACLKKIEGASSASWEVDERGGERDDPRIPTSSHGPVPDLRQQNSGRETARAPNRRRPNPPSPEIRSSRLEPPGVRVLPARPLRNLAASGEPPGSSTLRPKPSPWRSHRCGEAGAFPFPEYHPGPESFPKEPGEIAERHARRSYSHGG